MNIYDFDKTIYDGDSTAAFIGYCVKRYPKTLITFIPTAVAFLLYAVGIYTKTQFKERMYRFLRYIPDIDTALTEFWDKNECNILDYYMNQKSDSDIVISASPEFLLEPICRRLGITRLIASRVDKHTGKYTGENCWGAEKVIRLNDKYGITECDNFYSDSYSDTPLAEIAKNAFIVRRNTLSPWEEYKETLVKKAKKIFISKQFLLFILIGVINTVACIIIATILRGFIKGNPITADNISFALGYLGANIIGYILNSLVTFKERKLSVLKYIKFFLSYIPNYLIQQAIMALASTFTVFPMIIKSALAAIIGIPVTFIIMKVFTFAKKKEGV